MDPVISLGSSTKHLTREKLCEFGCSWIVCGNKSINDIVSYRTEDDSSETCTDAGGITLKIPEGTEYNGNHCVLSISCKWPLKMKIDAVDILANARHMELFSSSGEYLTTSQGFRVDEELGCDCHLYALQNSFQNPIPRFTVKFVSLEVPTELWLHSIHVTMCMTNTNPNIPMPSPHPLSLFGGLVPPKIDMEKVTTMLSEMGRQLTPQAEDLMHSVQSKQKERSQDIGNIPVMLASMLSQMKEQSLESTTGALSVPHMSIPSSQRDLLSMFSSSQSQNSICMGHSSLKPDVAEAKSQTFGSSIGNSAASGMEENSTLTPFDISKDHSDSMNTKELLATDFCSASESTDGKLERCLHCNAPISLGCLEQRLVLVVAEAENRLEKRLIDSIGELERRLTERLDGLLLCLRPNLSSNSDRILSRNSGLEPGLD